MRTLKDLLTVLALFFIGFNLPAQSEPGLEPGMSNTTLSCDPISSSFTIQGTSSLHDWEMVSHSCKGKLEYNETDGTIGISDIVIRVGVTTLKSGKKVMDKKCYAALKHEDHPNVLYKFKKLSSISKEGAGKYKAKLNGTLDVAGVAKSVNIDVTIEMKSGVMNIKGSLPMKMTDHNVEPPTALLGTLKTGNEITIIFNLNFVVS